MRGTGDIDGQLLADPVIDLLSQLAEAANRTAPPAVPAPSKDAADAGPA